MSTDIVMAPRAVLLRRMAVPTTGRAVGLYVCTQKRLSSIDNIVHVLHIESFLQGLLQVPTVIPEIFMLVHWAIAMRMITVIAPFASALILHYA